MSLSRRYSVLFDAVRIGPKESKNRFWATPHAIGFGSDHSGSAAGYRSMRAEGGWGVVFTEATTITPEMDKSPHRMSRLWDEGDVRNLAHVASEIQRHGALAGIELEYNAAVGPMTEGRGLTPRAIVATPGESSLAVPYAGGLIEADGAALAEIRDIYVAAALRAKKAGFDLITLHCGHAASILAHLLIPYYNTRTDEYGGSLENRARFHREVLTAVRAAVGPEVAVGLRLGVDTLDAPLGLGDRGLRADADTPLFIEHMDDLVDYWDFVIGGFDWAQDAQSSRTAAENFEKPWVGGLKAFTTKPVVNVGRLNSPDTMVDIVNAGQCDFIGAARAGISDPFLPNKIHAGSIEDIRECIGCNYCVSRDIGTMPIGCTQNATTGEEFRRGWHPEKFTRAANHENDVLIIGAGPAGMECATVLGKRGMRNVHLVDAADHLGGSIDWVATLPGRHEWRRLIEYREHQLRKLGNVEVILGNPMTVEDVLDYGAGIIITATGSHYTRDGINPHDRTAFGLEAVLGDRLLTPEQVVRDGAPVGQRVVVVDSDGYFMGPGIAEMLAQRGHEVILAARGEHIGEYQRYTREITPTLRDLRHLKVGLRVETTVTAVGPDSVRLSSPDRDDEVIGVDTVVLVGTRAADDEMYHGLMARRDDWQANEVSAVYRVGDCVRPHFIADAIFSGHRLAREIDSPDPTRPLPFIRERRIIGGGDADFVLGAPAQQPVFLNLSTL
ncbi:MULTISPECIES: FAD-dependent oxidoreductase [Nocardiaceae]|uniref:Dimethylamine/trimethylamine dehydrogenase n=1 Tax=Rhodococcoides corynebacterioides TaxID=53972 RepID=A0ABS2L0J5_9NOCA|nr:MULTISPECIES: FAD-dependent oxidoreductase [Rhodococcus]MBM7417410.1 dimethylamine/trimethylamine dehydrogenase [Rhodococcus corynebacterioides]MBP1115664.1 dimethylamine/trimethylamine dehydrogenase [Rhodococcus sp. PvP016]